MKRRTNLFYNSGDESNFLTFSNYTESLTGNYLSTDTKLYPSAFICLNVPKLTYESTDTPYVNPNKAEFINSYLIARYENKLATLRDYCDEKDLKFEETLHPLDYLLDYILQYDSTTTIEYLGNITEQQYNGIYADTICVVDPTNINNEYTLSESASGSDYADYPKTVTSYLYGWDNITLPTTLSSVQPLYDSGTQYNMASKYTAINYSTSVTEKQKIEFNVIIPLFDVLNINYDTNTAIIDEYNKDIDLSSTGSEKEYMKYIPLGIWFSNECSPVSLERDKITNFIPSWSLVISSQFKPLPYSKDVKADVYKSNNVVEAYNSFAQVLCKQDAINKRIDVLTDSVAKLSTAVVTLSSKINEIATTETIDEIQKTMLNMADTIEGLSSDIADLSNKIND